MAVIVILILVLIVVAVLLVRVCKHRAIGSSSSFSDKITSVNGSMTALQSPYGAQVAGKETLNYTLGLIFCKVAKDKVTKSPVLLVLYDGIPITLWSPSCW